MKSDGVFWNLNLILSFSNQLIVTTYEKLNDCTIYCEFGVFSYLKVLKCQLSKVFKTTLNRVYTVYTVCSCLDNIFNTNKNTYDLL